MFVDMRVAISTVYFPTRPLPFLIVFSLPYFFSSNPSSHREDPPGHLFNPLAKGLTHKLSSLQTLDLELLKSSSPPALSSSSSSASSSASSSFSSLNFPLPHLETDIDGDGVKGVNADLRCGAVKRKIGDKDEMDISMKRIMKRQRYDTEGDVKIQGSCEGYV
jgi:hypothetical protein